MQHAVCCKPQLCELEVTSTWNVKAVFFVCPADALRHRAPSWRLAPGGGISGIDILRLLSAVFMGHYRNTHISRNMRMHMCYADLHGATNRYRTKKRHALASGGAPLHGHGAHGHGHGACAFPPAPFSSGHPSIGARRRARSRLLSAACLRFRLGVEPLVRVRVSVMARVRLELGLGLGLG